MFMMSKSYLFTSESVSEGHPDKICDRISDEILDLYLREDPYARVAIETLATTNLVILAGEVRGPDTITQEHLEDLIRRTVRDIHYQQEGFDWQKLHIQSYIHEQSPDIARGVDGSTLREEGAGDQGIMFGYACRETPTFMPAAIHYAHTILRTLSVARRNGQARNLGPDAKSQVTLRYEDDVPVGVTSIVVSTQHDSGLTQAEVREIIRPYVQRSFPDSWEFPQDSLFYVNPTGRFVIGGPDGDAGLTGRKIVVDTYGGAIPHGGGAFSGKDPSKVDRSGAYVARYLAKNVVAAGLAEKCLIQLSYAIGVAKPLSTYVNLYGTGQVDVDRLSKTLQELVNLSPRGIREHLQLNRPIYARTAAYGHFGRDPEVDGGFSWEKTDLVPSLQSIFGKTSLC